MHHRHQSKFFTNENPECLGYLLILTCFLVQVGIFVCRRYNLPVPIAFLTIELRIEAAHSLKDKRQVVRSMKDKLRQKFNVSVAEIEATDLWQRVTVGVVSISDSRDYLESLMASVERHASRLADQTGAEVVDSFVDFL